MTKRTLSLRTERLSELTAADLTAVVAGFEVTGTGTLCVTQWPSCLNGTCHSFPCA